MRSTFSILFYINRQKIKKNGKCPIMGRITVDGKLSQFSIKEEIAPRGWSVKKGRSFGQEKADKELNRKLDHYEQKLKERYNHLIAEDAYVTADILKKALFTADDGTPMLLSEFEKYNREYLKSVGVTKSKSSYYGYVQTYKNLKKFIIQKCGLDDISFQDLQSSFIEDFDFYLRVNLRFSVNTTFNILMKLKRMVHIAINRGLIHKNPFANFKCEQKATTRRWLSKSDLDKLLHTPMTNPKAEQVRILFLFSTFTGLSYADLHGLKYENISTDEQGILWIRIRRKKTSTLSVVPIGGIALDIYNKYRNMNVNSGQTKVFEVPYYTLIHIHLEEVRKAVGLEVLCYHVARHSETFYYLLINRLCTAIFSIGNDLETSLVLRFA